MKLRSWTSIGPEIRFSFTVHSSLTHQHGITVQIPYTYEGKKVTEIISNSESKSYTVKSIKGVDYAWITIKPGSNYNVNVSYTDN